MIIEVLSVLYFFLPAYFANMTPVFARHLPWFHWPIDFGTTFRGKPLFGKNKTWRGLILGVFVGMMTFFVQQLLHLNGFVVWSLIDYPYFHVLLGAAIGFGALMGDAFESFIKRQLGVRAGKSLFFWDQIDFFLGALVVTVPYWWNHLLATVIAFVVVLALTIFIQKIGYWLKLKSDPL